MIGNNIRDDGAKFIGEAMKENAGITTLYLECNYLYFMFFFPPLLYLLLITVIMSFVFSYVCVCFSYLLFSLFSFRWLFLSVYNNM